MQGGFISSCFQRISKIPVKCLDGFPPVICRVFLFIGPTPKLNIVFAFEPLEPVVAGFEFLCFLFAVAQFDFLFHFFLNQIFETLLPVVLRSSRSSPE